MDQNNIKLLEEFLLNSNVDIDLSSFIIAILSSLFLALIVKFTYLKVSRSLNDKEHFSEIFVPLAIITTLVITVVKFSLALSLGLVGALSIVRFRAAIKEPEELVYLFFIIGIGLANGANQILIAFSATFLLILILFLRMIYNNKIKNKNISEISTNILQIQIENNAVEINGLIENLKKNLIYLNLKSFTSEKNFSQYNFWFDIDPKNFDNLLKQVNEIVSEKKEVKIQLFSRSGIYE